MLGNLKEVQIYVKSSRRVCCVLSLVACFGLAACGTSSTGGTVYKVCGFAVGQAQPRQGRPYFVDLTSEHPPQRVSAFAVGESDKGTSVRISSGCRVGATAVMAPAGSAKLTVLKQAEDGHAVLILVALSPTAAQTTLTTTQHDGKKRRLLLVKRLLLQSPSFLSGAPTSTP